MGQAIIGLNKRVTFISVIVLVQYLQVATQQLQCPVTLTKIDHFDLLILDNVGDVKKVGDETSVLVESGAGVQFEAEDEETALSCAELNQNSQIVSYLKGQG